MENETISKEVQTMIVNREFLIGQLNSFYQSELFSGKRSFEHVPNTNFFQMNLELL